MIFLFIILAFSALLVRVTAESHPMFQEEANQQANTYHVGNNKGTNDEGLGLSTLRMAAMVVGPGVEVSKTLVSPPGGIAVISNTITFTIRISNTGGTAITKMPLYDYYCPACLEFTSWSITPTDVDHHLGVLHWADLLAGQSPLLPGHTMVVTVDFHTVLSNTMYWKESGWLDYAPKGMPDFDQKQDAWDNPPGSGKGWYYCGPVAVANSLWWFDSKFEPNPVPPPTINDGYPLVPSYHPSWDDHDPQNVQRLANTLAGLMGTTPVTGTNVHNLAAGIQQHINNQGLGGQYTVTPITKPTFEWVEKEVRRSEDVILLLGFWQDVGGVFKRVGGHYVTVAGVDSENLKIAFSDPYFDRAEQGWLGRVLPNPHLGLHPPLPPDMVHNDAKYASHDVYTYTQTGSPGGGWGPMHYAMYCDDILNFQGQNEGDYPNTATCDPSKPIFTEVEYAVAVSPITPTILCDLTDNMAVVSGAMDESGAEVPEAQGHARVAVNQPPTLGTVTPSSGSAKVGVMKYFTTTYRDLNGYVDLQWCYFLIGTSTAPSNTVYLGYNQTTNKLYLRNNNGTGWWGGYAPGSANIIQNAQGKLDCSKTKVWKTGNQVKVRWAVTFKSGYTGSKKLYLKAKDRRNHSVGWTKKGTVTINP